MGLFEWHTPAVKRVGNQLHLPQQTMDSHDPVTGITAKFCPRSDPICASTLAGKEASLHDRLATWQPVKYGCTELDSAILLGGLQRGSVVGVSADDADGFGLLVRSFFCPLLRWMLKRLDGVPMYDKSNLGRLSEPRLGNNTKTSGIGV